VQIPGDPIAAAVASSRSSEDELTFLSSEPEVSRPMARPPSPPNRPKFRATRPSAAGCNPRRKELAPAPSARRARVEDRENGDAARVEDWLAGNR
jgi:hypothetical protein